MNFNSGPPAGGGFNFSALTSATNPASTTPSSTLFGATANPMTSAPPGVAKPLGTGFSFAAPATSSTTSGGGAKPPGLGLGFASPTTSSTPSGGAAKPPGLGFGFGAPAPSTTSGGFSFATPSTAASKPLTLAGLSATTATTTAAAPLFAQQLGSTAPTTTGLSLSNANPTSATTSLGLTLGSLGTTSTGLTLGTSSGLGLSAGGLGTLGSTAPTGLLAAKHATTTAAATTSSGGLTLGGLGGTSSTPTTTSSVVHGLGGVDPATSQQNAGKASGASGDGKRVKEESMPNELVDTVTKFKDYVKEQKDVAAKISIVSNQNMTKVKEQTGSLKNHLSTVAVGLHRNVVALDKLKKQTSQELHNVEMAHRTKETPPGLQYENNAPNQYFYELLESFDTRMALYRKLIEDTEGYLVGAQQGSTITPKDLFVCLKKLHETFIALAAQLQGIHEQIKEQKEQYLAYRKIFHNDETDVFEKRKKVVSDRSKLARTSQPLGPASFTGLSNYAAMMMSAAMNRQALQQQPGAEFGMAAPAAAQPPTGGLFGGSTGFGGFGSTATQPTGLFGNTTVPKPTFGFGAPATTSAPSLFGFPSSSTAATKPAGFGFGSTTTTSAPTFGFGSAAASKPTGFGFGSTPATGTSLFGTPSTAAVKPLGLALPTQSLGSSAPFTLQPAPNKRPGTTQ